MRGCVHVASRAGVGGDSGGGVHRGVLYRDFMFFVFESRRANKLAFGLSLLKFTWDFAAHGYLKEC